VLNLPPKARILLIRTDRIGDVVLSTPVASAIKRAWPEAKVIFLAREYTKPLLELHRDVDVVWTEEEIENGGNPVEALKKAGVAAAIALHPDLKWAWRMARAHIPIRVGTAYRAFSFLYTTRVFEHRKRSLLHEVEHNLNLLQPFGIEGRPVRFHFQVPSAVLEKVRELLDSRGVVREQPFVVLHPGSGGSAVDWPLSFFGELARKLRARNLPVVVTGAVSERLLGERLVEIGGSGVINLAGEIDLTELAAVLKWAHVVVANSTGPLHIAVAMGTEVVGFYCPVPPCSPQRWGPYGRPDSVLVPSRVSCKTCGDKTCVKSRCMEQISVQTVLEKVLQKMKIES